MLHICFLLFPYLLFQKIQNYCLIIPVTHPFKTKDWLIRRYEISLGKVASFEMNKAIKKDHNYLLIYVEQKPKSNGLHDYLDRMRANVKSDIMRSRKNTVTPYPCAKCTRECPQRQDALCCDGCWQWVHRTCTTMSTEEYRELVRDDRSLSRDFFCTACSKR